MGFESTIIRMKGDKSTNKSPCPTILVGMNYCNHGLNISVDLPIGEYEADHCRGLIDDFYCKAVYAG